MFGVGKEFLAGDYPLTVQLPTGELETKNVLPHAIAVRILLEYPVLKFYHQSVKDFGLTYVSIQIVPPFQELLQSTGLGHIDVAITPVRFNLPDETYALEALKEAKDVNQIYLFVNSKTSGENMGFMFDWNAHKRFAKPSKEMEIHQYSCYAERVRRSPNSSCKSCGKEAGVKLPACPFCGMNHYCNETCQRAHWTLNHGKNCDLMTAIKASVGQDRRTTLSPIIVEASIPRGLHELTAQGKYLDALVARLRENK